MNVILGVLDTLNSREWLNLSFGRLPLEKLNILKVVTWEIALRKVPFGKYLTPHHSLLV